MWKKTDIEIGPQWLPYYTYFLKDQISFEDIFYTSFKDFIFRLVSFVHFCLSFLIVIKIYS